MSTQYLSHHAGRIAYDDTGSGPLVLCAPSIGDVRAGYDALIIDMTDVLISSYQTGGSGGADVATGLPTGKREIAADSEPEPMQRHDNLEQIGLAAHNDDDGF